ncbi:DUF2854 domain-containing protein [Prochlorococcus sp. MIT 1341]|uniref:DUF2854 domain-containing protein n=1 Tax=Prochlorococcus sp. MIT 1341 TaxID=3096221 RepID=UPI002A758B01|nr:DUF2854 domain-containing protein [Prochlorococcus sp. MIT 1341]
MKELFSPANVITVTGAFLTVIGAVAYGTGAANLSVPTLFYGFPIFLGGLALKTSELPPAKKIPTSKDLTDLQNAGPPELKKLVGDVTRWRYGQKTHLESSLQVLKLWDNDKPPKLLEIEELDTGKGYGVRLRFEIGGVALERWEEKKDRLSRFFAKGLQAELLCKDEGLLDLMLLPIQSKINAQDEHASE